MLGAEHFGPQLKRLPVYLHGRLVLALEIKRIHHKLNDYLN